MKEEQTVSVEELIRRYNDELLAMKKKYDTQTKPIFPVLAQAKADSSIPNMEEDLRMLREQEGENITAEQAENNAVNEEMDGQTDAAPIIPPYEVDGEILPPSTPPPQEMSLGYLKAFVTTARGALPIANAQVIITRLVGEEELLEQAARTDQSGYSPLFTLPAVSGTYSLTPTASTPFTFYNMYVRADGFYPIVLREIPMYGGITAVQPVDLIPITEGDTSIQQQVFIEGAPAVSENAQRGDERER